MAARWTAEHDRIVLAYPAPEAAKRLGRTIGAVYQRRYLLEADRLKRPWTEAEERLIVRLPLAQAIAYTKRSADAIRQRLAGMGLEVDETSGLIKGTRGAKS
jgi:hypothetical protein